MRKKAVEQQYLLAMETSQRVVEEIALKDENQIGNVLEEIENITEVLNSTKPAFESGADFAESFAVHDIFSELDKTFENEQKIILGLIDNLNDAMSAFGSVVPENLMILEFFNKVKQYFEINDEGESPVYDKMEDCIEDFNYYSSWFYSDSDYWYSTSDWYSRSNSHYDSWYYDNYDSWYNTNDSYSTSYSDYDSWYSSYSYYYPWYSSWYSSYDPSCYSLYYMFEGDEVYDFYYWYFEDVTVSRADAAMNEISTIRDAYNEMITYIYDGSYVQLSDFEDHEECIEVMESVEDNLSVILPELSDALYYIMNECFWSMGEICLEYFGYMLDSYAKYKEENLETQIEDLIKCNWVRKKWNAETNEGRYSEVDATLGTALQHDNSVKYYFKKLKKDFSEIENHFIVECTPLSSKLNKSLEMNITKSTAVNRDHVSSG